MRVVEIGCGAEAGPLFESAAEHIIVDTDVNALCSAHVRDLRLRPMIADATDLDELEDASVEIILARNVFSDPTLVLSNSQKRQLTDELKAHGIDSRAEELDKQLAQLEAQSILSKGAIMREAARILITNGRLIAVEQQSPKVAGRFFAGVAEFGEFDAGFDFDAAFDIESGVPLAEVTPTNYAAAHDSSKTETWVATKK